MSIRKLKRRAMSALGRSVRVEFRIDGLAPDVCAWLSSPRGNAFVIGALRDYLKAEPCASSAK